MIYMALAAYNEEKNIGELLKAVQILVENDGQDITLVIVNDGSSDSTAEIIKGYQHLLKIRLIHQQNQGFLKALSNALREVARHAKDDDICITMDADNTHPVPLILGLAERVNSGKDVVIASRYQPGGGMRGVPLHRSILSEGAKRVMSLAIGIPNVRDYSTAFRAIRVSTLKRAFEKYGDNLLDGKGFSGMAGFLIRLSYITDQIDEIPLLLRYDLKKGASSMSISKTLTGYLEIIYGYRSGKFKG